VRDRGLSSFVSEVHMTDPPKDLFDGRENLRRFSDHIAAGERVTDEEVVSAFSPALLESFRYAAKTLAGRVRRVTGAPSISHSVDSALRAKLLGFSEDYVRTCLLHDVVEDTSKNLEQIAQGLQKVRSRFGDEVARDVRILTNRYSVIFETVAPLVMPRLPFELESLEPVRVQISRMRRELPETLQREFSYEFPFLLDHFYNQLLNSVNLDSCKKRANLDHNYTFVSELKLQAYHVYIVELADDACTRLNPWRTLFYDRALVTKGLDVVDNQWTAPVVSTDLERVILKAEIWLDRCFYLIEWLDRGQHNTTAFRNLYEYVKLQTIQQLIDRKHALDQLTVRQFEPIAKVAEAQIRRLKEKYRVDGSPVLEIARLTEAIQKHNRELAG
jgi:hypothetical protein